MILSISRDISEDSNHPCSIDKSNNYRHMDIRAMPTKQRQQLNNGLHTPKLMKSSYAISGMPYTPPTHTSMPLSISPDKLQESKTATRITPRGSAKSEAAASWKTSHQFFVAK
jgi:hypothetical protein